MFHNEPKVIVPTGFDISLETANKTNLKMEYTHRMYIYIYMCIHIHVCIYIYIYSGSELGVFILPIDSLVIMGAVRSYFEFSNHLIYEYL